MKPLRMLLRHSNIEAGRTCGLGRKQRTTCVYETEIVQTRIGCLYCAVHTDVADSTFASITAPVLIM
jgi:hypothetical protein